jgi:hypothetical protein
MTWTDVIELSVHPYMYLLSALEVVDGREFDRISHHL